MNLRRLGYNAAGIIAGVILLFILTVAFIPTDSIRGLVLQGLALNGYSMTSGELRKTLPLGILARKLEISGAKGPVFKADEAAVRLKILPLLMGSVQVGVDAKVGTGTISANCTVNRGGSVRFEVTRVRLEDIPFFSTVAGMQAKGSLRAKGFINGLRKSPSGDIQMEVVAAEFTGIKVGAMPLPDAAYPVVQGKLTVRGGKAVLESFTLQGEGLYARLKGDFPVVAPISSSPLNVVLELMPKPEFLEKQKWVFLLLTKYLDTPGHYQVPVRGTLGQPSVF